MIAPAWKAGELGSIPRRTTIKKINLTLAIFAIDAGNSSSKRSPVVMRDSYFNLRGQVKKGAVGRDWRMALCPFLLIHSIYHSLGVA